MKNLFAIFIPLFFVITVWSAVSNAEPTIYTPGFSSSSDDDNSNSQDETTEESKSVDSSKDSTEEGDKESTEESSEETPAKAEAENQAVPQAIVDPTKVVYILDPALNISIGYEVNDGDVHLIVEMDHNPSKDEFIFDFQRLSNMKEIISSVLMENQRFGFKNRPVAMMPLIEVQNMNTGAVKFILGANNYRTYQRVNLSKILRAKSDRGQLIDPSKMAYDFEDIKEIQIITKTGINDRSQVPVLFNYLSIPLDSAVPNVVHQIYGTQTLADISELGKYNVGDLIQVEEGYKMPYRSKDTQWVMRPELTEGETATYQLIENPKLGDRYTLPAAVANWHLGLPKLKEGYVWVLFDETSEERAFVMAQDSAKLSPKILVKYIKGMAATLDSAYQKGQDLAKTLTSFFQKSPIQIQAHRLPIVVETLLSMNDIDQMLKFLMLEQRNYPVIELSTDRSNANQCSAFLN